MIIFCNCNVVGKDYRWLESSPNSNLSQALLGTNFENNLVFMC